MLARSTEDSAHQETQLFLLRLKATVSLRPLGSQDYLQTLENFGVTISDESYALDQRSGDGWFSGWFKIFVINTEYFNCRILKYSMRGLLQHWTESSIIRWNFIINDEKMSSDDIMGGFVQIKNTSVSETQDRIGIVWPGDSSEEIRTWLSQIENDGEKKYRARHTKLRILAPEMEIMIETPWSRIREQNSVYKEFLEIVGNGSSTGSVPEETIAVPATISISVEKWQSNTSPNSFMQQNERKTSRTRSPSGRMSRWPCKDYLKGTCDNSFCEKWHPPECLFYKTKSGCRFRWKVLVCTPSGWWTT